MRPILILCLGLSLSGCMTDQPVVQVTKPVVVDIPEAFYRCDSVKLPDYRKLTDRQVAMLLVAFSRENDRCRRNLEAIRKLVGTAKGQIEE
jgi:hypothetical protein